jgi:hypothetical protein
MEERKVVETPAQETPQARDWPTRAEFEEHARRIQANFDAECEKSIKAQEEFAKELIEREERVAERETAVAEREARVIAAEERLKNGGAEG